MDQHQQTQGMLSSIFGGKPATPTEMFQHPNERDILVSAIEVLKECETGGYLLGVLKEKKIRVHVIKNRNAHAYSPDSRTIYLGVPPAMEKADPYAVLELGAALREIEQDLMGFTLPPEDADPLMAASTRHAKYLDIIAHMCKIAHELEVNVGTSSYVETVERLGHGETYKAYLAQASHQEMAETYIKAHDKVQ